MILIIGNNHDDVLYFESIARETREEIILKKYHATIGSIFNQQVLIVKDIYTSYLSSAIASYLIEKYHVLIIFAVGKCRALTKELRCGDIAVSKSIFFGDVDLVDACKGTKFGQVPGFPQCYDVNTNLLAIMNTTLDRTIRARHFECSFISSSVYTSDFSQIDRFQEILDVKGETVEIVIDNDTAGICLAAQLFDIPCISVKVIESRAEEDPTVDTYLRVLKQYSLMGKAVVSCIGEIGRNDVLR